MWLWAFLACLPVYAATAHYRVISIDTNSALVPAWHLVHHGNVWLEDMRKPPYWTLWAHGHLVSNRMMGVILPSVPAYAALAFLGPSRIPAALTAVILAAATVATLLLVLRRLASDRLAIAATAVLALGTSMWTINSAEIWTHTVDGLAIAVAAYAFTRQRYLLAGLAFGIGLTARPHVVLIAAVVGLWIGWRARTWRPPLLMAAAGAPWVALLIGWNTLVYGHPSLAGGYPSATSRLGSIQGSTSAGLVHEVGTYAANLAGFLFSPLCGLVLYLPLVVVLIFGGRTGWRHSPDWARGLLLGGVVYTLAQLEINGFTGGSAFYGYRLASELVLCAVPFALVTYRTWAHPVLRRRRTTHALAVLSTGIQATGAFLYSVGRADSDGAPWQVSKYLGALLWHPVAGTMMFTATVLACLWVLNPPTRRADAAEQRNNLVTRSPGRTGLNG